MPIIIHQNQIKTTPRQITVQTYTHTKGEERWVQRTQQVLLRRGEEINRQDKEAIDRLWLCILMHIIVIARVIEQKSSKTGTIISTTKTWPITTIKRCIII